MRGSKLSRDTITRTELAVAVHENVGLPRSECAALVDTVLKSVTDELTAGEPVKISSFGTFNVRQKRERTGRNPKTGESAKITARKVVTFRASNILKKTVQSRNAE